MNAHDVVDLISETYHEAGYVVRDQIQRSHFADMQVVDMNSPGADGADFAKQLTDMFNVPQSHTIRMQSAFNVHGDYIGSPEIAELLCGKYGIAPEVIPGDKVCSIGFSTKDGKWYGWSHRAIAGFKVGDVAKEGDCCTEPGSIASYIAEHPEKDMSVPVGFEAKTITDAKRMAIAFADSVG